jgi:hypothetical protein
MYIQYYYLDKSSTAWFIPLIFALGTFYMYILSTNAPPLNEENDRYSLIQFSAPMSAF